MLTKDKPRIILIVVYIMLVIAAFMIPPRMFGTSTGLPVSQIAMGVLLSTFHLMDYALMRGRQTPTERQTPLARTPVAVAVGLAFVCIGLGYLTDLYDIFMPLICVVMLIGILGGFYMSARIRLRTDPPPAEAGLLARMGLTIWEVAIIVILLLGAAYIMIFGVPSSIGVSPE